MSDERQELKTTGIPESEYSLKFLQGMVNRMGVSYHKYGAAELVYPDEVNALASMQVRLRRYADTGNTEWLIDAANFLMLEFMFPAHPEAHYRGTDSDESPGRVNAEGVATDLPNRNVHLAHKDSDQ